MKKSKDFAMMAQQARNRLSKRSEFRKTNSRCMGLRAEKNYLITTSATSIDEKDNLFLERVKQILQNDNELEAINLLMDRKLYNTMNEAEKQRYVLNLSKRFLEAKKLLSMT